ncbi:MAG: EAL domain-containing protein [Chloroflexota bacterium]
MAAGRPIKNGNPGLTKAVWQEHSTAPDAAFVASLLEHTADIIVAYDLKGIIQYVSPSVQRVLGRDPSTLVGSSLLANLHPEDAVRARGRLRRMRQGAHGFRLSEYRIQHADGRWLTLEVSSNVLPGNSSASVLAIARDVTERRQAQETASESDARLRVLTEATLEGIIIHEGGLIIEANPAAAEMFGFTREEGVGHQVLEFIAPESHLTIMQNMISGNPHPYEVVGLRKDGSRFDLEIVARLFPLRDREVRVATIRDITQRRRREHLYRLLNEIDSQVLTNQPVPAILELVSRELVKGLRTMGAVIEASASTESDASVMRAWAGRPETAPSTPPRPEVPPAILTESRAAGTPQRWHIDEVQSSGAAHWPSEYCLTVPMAAHGRALGVVTVFADRAGDLDGAWVAELADFASRLALSIVASGHQAEIRHLAMHDPLTELPNRRALSDALERSVAQAGRGRRGALLMMDLDHFKSVNDTLGHAAGDLLLARVAAIIVSELREVDLLARLGGDEFAALLDDVTMDDARVVADRVRGAIEDARFVIDERVFSLGVSIGVAPIDARVDAESVLALADTALYGAKEQGKNRVVTLSATDRRGIVSCADSTWATTVKDALRQNQLELHVQPVVRLSDQHVSHYEGLLRIRGEDGQLLPPGLFLPSAERFGLMPALDRWVVNEALRYLSHHPWLELFVNLSGPSLTDQSLMEMIEHRLGEVGVEPSRLGFEVTETSAIRKLDHAQRFIGRLTDLGCRFALDDFGVDFSSFSYLRSLPVQIVKIDGSFVRDIRTDRGDRAIVDAITTVCHALNRQVVAEWIETPDVAADLRDMGVEFGQGFLWGTAVPVETLARRSAA